MARVRGRACSSPWGDPGGLSWPAGGYPWGYRGRVEAARLLAALDDVADPWPDPGELLADVLAAHARHRPAWYTRAACRGAPADWFFAERGSDCRRGARLCAACPVSDPCAGYASSRGLSGLWGGRMFTDGRPRRRATPPG